MSQRYLASDIARHIWETKYRLRDEDDRLEASVEETWQRIARAAAGVEREDRAGWERRFYEALEGFRFLPGGRILAGAGSGRRVTLFNCFVMGVIEDSMDGIFDALKQGALTMQQGGGVGYDFSTLRPRGTPARASGTVASGPVSFMRIWDSTCATLLSTGARRGAMMATLRCDHPDVEEYVVAKRDRDSLRHFNLSVQVTDAFMQAVREDAEWPLAFPADALGDDADAATDTVMRRWTGAHGPIACRVLRRVGARALWDRIMRATYEFAEPGVLFVDRINRANNLWYREHITATNPCGELPLPPYGACDLGSINLTRFVLDPFSERARIDFEGIRATVAVATRLLDDVIDLSRFPLERQAEQARGSRHVGLGLTGLGDALIMLGLHYGEPAARELAARVMQTITYSAYATSLELATEKGPFPWLDADAYLRGEFAQRLPAEIRAGIAARGIRNSHLTAIAPTGTISLLAGNVSSGIEPVFDAHHTRRVLEADGRYASHTLTDHAIALWRARGERETLPPAFVEATALPPIAHLEMQAALQPFVDGAISKTINVPESFPFEDFRSLYELAFEKGLKGCTTFRPNPITGSVLAPGAPTRGAQAHHCCGIEREAD